jgi:YVTN family beta-propeller protein
MGLASSPDGAQVFVSLGRAKAIALVDAASYKVLKVISDVGDRPWGIAAGTDGKSIYTANGPSADVSLIDLASGAVKRISTGGSPWGAVIGK